MPFATRLCDKLETQDTILGQEHVLLENVHALDTLFAENLGQGVVTVEILLQGTTHNGTVAIGGEGTGQHGDVAERGLERLIENV